MGRFAGAGIRRGSYARAIFFCATAVLVASALVAASGRDALQKAAVLVQQGRLEEAEQQARLALSDPDARAVAYSVLGTIRVQQKKFAESALFLQQAIRLEPQLVGAHLTLAQVYALQGRSDPALRMFRRVLELDPTNATARLALARSAMEKRQYAESLEIARPAMAAIRQTPEGLFVLVADLVKTGDRAAARELVNEWAGVPDRPRELSLKLALVLVDENMVPDAITVLEQAGQNGPPSFDLAFNLGGAYLLNGDLPRALDAYDAALTLNAQSLPALRQAAAASEKNGELERSLSYWIRARKLMPDDPEVLLGFGRVCLKMDLLQDAEPALEKAVALNPGDPSYQYTLAAAKVGKKQFEEAQVLLEALLRKHPEDPHLLYGLGAVFYSQGRLADAAARLAESLRRQPDQLASRYYLALIARDEGRDAEAIEMLEALLQRYPDHAASSEALGGLLMSVQRLADAETRLRTAVRLNPQSVKANYQLGLLLARTGRKEEADKQFVLAKELRQEDEATSRLQLRLLEPQQ